MSDISKQFGTEKRKDMADRDTPLIRNEWYVAALSEELGRKPIRRTIVEQDIVMYRREEGTPVALQNRCAHRSYPLHLGGLNGDRIVCGYHGFEYDPDGRCAHVPSLDAPRPGIRVQSYPVVEVGPFVWIWAGDPEAVDFDKLVKQPWFTEKGWRYVSGYFDLEASYLGLHENLMDLTHFPFLHEFARGHVALARHEQKIDVSGDEIRSVMALHNFPINEVNQKVCQYEGQVTATTYVEPPQIGMFYAKSVQTDRGDTREVETRYIVHCMTPETQTKSHYFWAVSRNTGLDSDEYDAEISRLSHGAFYEDKIALEEVERMIERDNRPGFKEALVKSDTGGVLILRMIARRAAAEAEAGAAGITANAGQ